MNSLQDNSHFNYFCRRWQAFHLNLLFKFHLILYKITGISVNSLPNNKILDQSKFKAFVDDKINVTKELEFVSGRVENIVGKKENAGNQHFLLFPQCCQKASFPLL